MSVLGILFTVAALLVALYGANALLLALLYLRHRLRCAARSERRRGAGESGASAPPPVRESWPVVTVQLPIYNELLVLKRLLDAVARLDYPRGRLQVQVLDDSTDETTRLAGAWVAQHRARGLDIELIHRKDRTGFKAGALAHGLETATGEFIAIFDADFAPPADFLRRTVPHLAADPGLAFVQTRWGYLNADYSALTRAQTIALDGHFVVEHLGRNQSGLLMNFNGTAGIWRREAIADAGGWRSDTLTEDVDLSFRAQLAGWRALYLPEIEAPAELPPQVAAFRRQQARWATGAAQCLVKLGGALWRGSLNPLPASRLARGGQHGTPSESQAASGSAVSASTPAHQRETSPSWQRVTLSWPARLEAILHLSVWLAHPMSLVLLLLTPLMLLGRIPLTLNLTIFWLMALGPIFAYALSQRHLYQDWRRRMLYMPVLALIGAGLALSNTIAITQGLVGRQQPFRRTPKFRLERRQDRWAGTRYALPFEWVTVGELILAGYALAATALAVSIGHYFSVPFLLLYAGGYGFMASHGLRDAWLGWRSQPSTGPRPLTAESKIE